MKIYNKLVRDNIPQIIKESGRNCTIKKLNDNEYFEYLNEKLKEEIDEYICDNDVEELVDIVEIIMSILKTKNISLTEFEKMKNIKKQKRGGFEKKILLISID
ncbi:MAG: phosphoribosyl-ATP pyrophosphohydrolase [Candidatus Lokiarchaeota archaeon]|nr:phosphoribosyl-ATP pyrophosphohydrolase [Candidatus Lokiarchaeota archaeon]